MRRGWAFTWAGLSLGLGFHLGYSQNLVKVKNYPYSCTEIFRTTYGTHSEIVYDYLAFKGTTNVTHVFPYYDPTTDIIGGMVIRNVLPQGGSYDKCSASNEIVMMKPMVSGVYPPMRPACCDMKKGTISFSLSWQKVVPPQLHISLLGSTGEYYNLSSNTTQLYINCGGVIKDKPKNPDINIK